MRLASILFIAGVLGGCSCGGDEASLEGALDRSDVQLHAALRGRLEGEGGPALARSVVEAASSEARATALAETLFDARDEGAARLRDEPTSPRALAPLLVEGSTLDGATDRAAFFLALWARKIEDDATMPPHVLAYEASRLQPDAIQDPALRKLAQAAAALAYARVGLCEQAEAEADAAEAVELPPDAVGASVARWLPESSVRPAQLHADLLHASALLAGGARSCCRLLSGDTAAAASSIDRWIDDAEALGVSELELSILRGWGALARHDDAEARAQLERIRGVELRDEHAGRYKMLRDAVASRSRDAMGDAAESIVDRRWLSGLVSVATHRALERNGLIPALREQPEAQALDRLSRGEAAVFRAARARFPLFDQAHQGDRGFMSRLGELFE